MSSKPQFYAAVIVIDSLGRVLLGKRLEDGLWTSPGGGANDGELPIQAAAREAFEESGLVIDPGLLQPLPTITTRSNKSCYCYLYIARPGDLTTSKLDPDQEVRTWKWFYKDEIPNSLRESPGRFESVRNAYMKFHGIVKSLSETLEKGGPGSGIKGHQTLHHNDSHKNVRSLAEKLSSLNEYDKQLRKLETGSYMEGVTLRSGKPVFNNYEQGVAHGYSAEEHREAGSIHYELADKMAHNIKKIKDAGATPDPSMKKIESFHRQQFKRYFGSAERVEKLQQETKNVLQERKQEAKVKKASKIKPEAAESCVRKLTSDGVDLGTAYAQCSGKRRGLKNNPLEKSTVMMGHNDAAEIDTAKFAIEHEHAMNSEWLETLAKLMDGYSYGEIPRSVVLDRGELFLVRVEEGLYSGLFKQQTTTPDGIMQDNAKVRLERMTLPSLVNFCIAKEWINPTQYAPPVPVQVFQPETKPVELDVVISESVLDKRLRMLQLLSKLMD